MLRQQKKWYITKKKRKFVYVFFVCIFSLKILNNKNKNKTKKPVLSFSRIWDKFRFFVKLFLLVYIITLFEVKNKTLLRALAVNRTVKEKKSLSWLLTLGRMSVVQIRGLFISLRELMR